jgi:apolipoprotein N-acyltransferase
MVRLYDIFLALLSGVLLTLGFPPFDLYPLAWFGLLPLFIALLEKKVIVSFYLGTLTGLVYFLGTVYWVFNSIYYYGNLPTITGLLLVLTLCLYLGLYVGMFSAFFNFLSRKSRLPAVLTVPLLWVTLEYGRTYALTGFPWAVLGYSQHSFLPLIQISDVTGVYGVSFLVAACNGLLYEIAVLWPRRRSKMPLSAGWPVPVSIVVFVFILSISLAYGSWRLNAPEESKTIRVSVIQGNIEQRKKWDKRFEREVIDTYKRLSIMARKDVPELMVWPESALPFVFGHDRPLTEEFKDFQKGLGTYLLFGSVTSKASGAEEQSLANSAVLVSSEGGVVSVYDKIHLVPYGEYVPLKRVFPFIKKLTAGIGDFIPGQETVVMETPFARIGNLICYEIIFPGLVRKFTHNGANLLVTITNDAWFGRTSAPFQHFSMAVFRAVENRVPVIRSANTGISGIIDAKGMIIRKTDIFEEAVITENVQVRGSSQSFYSRYGDIFTFLCLTGTILLIAGNISSSKP